MYVQLSYIRVTLTLTFYFNIHWGISILRFTASAFYAMVKRNKVAACAVC